MRRDLAAIAHVASLLPANADEANLAAQCVAAGAQALDCAYLARTHADDPKFAMRFHALSASMMREARGWRTALLRAQAARRTREADETASEAAIRTEQRALALLADALQHVPPPPVQTDPAKHDWIAEAESYALVHRKRATLIRRFGRVPDRLNCGPLRPELVRAIATGTTPALQALDQKPQRATSAAA